MSASPSSGIGLAVVSGRASIGSRVYSTLRESIINLALKPGDEISMNSMVEQLGVSRSPVRDALLELGTEGLVDIIPQKGSFVSRIDLARVYEERFLRQCLEEKAVELFVSNKSSVPRYLSTMKILLEAQKKDLASGDLVRFVGHDDAFHEQIFRGAGKPLCWNIIRDLSGHYHRMRLLNQSKSSVPSGVISQHVALLELIEAGDAKAAAASCAEHLSRLLLEESELLAAWPQYFVKKEN